MKKKKLVALVLAMVMLVSSLSAVTAAFAAENDNLQTVRGQIDAVTTLKDINGDAVVNAFNNLSNEDKDALGAEYILKIYRMAFTEATGTDTEKDVAARALLGEYTPAMKEGFTLRSYLVKEINKKIEVTVDGITGYYLLEPSAYNYVGDTTVYIDGQPVTVSAKTQNAILDKAIKLYSDASDAAKEYATVMNDLGVIGGGNVSGRPYGALGRTRLFMNVVGRANATAQAWNDFANEKGYPVTKPADPSASIKGDTEYDTYIAEYNRLWKDIVTYSGWGEAFVGSACGAQLAELGLTAAEAIAKVPEIKNEKTAKDAKHKLWVEQTKEYKDYLANLAKYNAGQDAYGAYQTDVRIAALNKTGMSAREKNAIDAAHEVMEAYKIFSADKTNEAKEKAAVEAYANLYEPLSAFEKNNVIGDMGSPAYYYVDGKTMALPEAMKKAANVKNNRAYQNFIVYVKGLTVPAEKTFENNKLIDEMEAKFKAIDKSFSDNLAKDNKAAYDNYVAIKAMRRYSYPTDQTTPGHEGFESQSVALNTERNLPRIAGMILPKANGVLSVLLGSIMENPTAKPGAYKQLFTGDNVTFLMKTIYPLIAGLDIGISLSFPPAEIGKMLVSDNPDYTGRNFAKAKETLMAAATWEDVGKVDWEIEDNNYDQFADAMIASLRPILSLLPMVGLSFTNSSTVAEYDPNTATKDFKYGAYELVIIPLIEALGGQVTMTSDAYTQAVAAQMSTNTDIQYKLLFDQFKPIVQQLLANPADYLAGALPNLMYHLQDGCLLNAIRDYLSTLGIAGINLGDIDFIKNLSWNSIVAMLDPLLADLGFSLTDLDLEKLASLGKGTERATARANETTTFYVEGDKESVYNYLANTIDALLVKLGVIDLGTPAEFVKAEAPVYPHNGKMDQKVMTAMIDGLDGLLGGVINIKELIDTGLCTNAMAAQAVQAIYGLLGNLNLDIFAVELNTTPDAVANALNQDEKYQSLAADLAGHTSWADVGLYLTNGDTVVYQADMGFKDGDRAGFFDSIVACLRPLTKALADANLLVNTVRADGTTAYGIYDLIIVPLFEDLGLSITSSDVYTSNYNKLILKQDKGFAYDYLINTILSPVLTLVEQLEAAPVKTLMSLLPNLAYQAQHGELLSLLAGIPGLGENGRIDLAGLVNGLLAGAEISIELPNLDLDMVASRGTFVTKDSTSSLREQYTTVTANKEDMFVSTWYYLYDTVNYKDNLQNIKSLLGGIEGLDPALSGLIDSLLNEIFTASKEESLCKMGALLASDVWQCPDEADAKGNSGTKTPSTGDYAIPAAAFLAVMFSAGAAIVLLRRKKVSAQ